MPQPSVALCNPHGLGAPKSMGWCCKLLIIWRHRGPLMGSLKLWACGSCHLTESAFPVGTRRYDSSLPACQHREVWLQHPAWPPPWKYKAGWDKPFMLWREGQPLPPIFGVWAGKLEAKVRFITVNKLLKQRVYFVWYHNKWSCIVLISLLTLSFRFVILLRYWNEHNCTFIHVLIQNGISNQ